MAYSWLPMVLAVVLAIPGGWLATHLIRRESASRVAIGPIVAAYLVLAIWGALVMPDIILLALALVLAWALLVLGTVDLIAFRLPDALTLPLIALGLLLSFQLSDLDPVAHFAGAAIGFAVLYGISVAYRSVRGREGLGLGDAKLAAAAGAWLGWRALPSMLLIACAAGFVAVGLGVIFRGKQALRDELAFGVPLCLAFWLVWLYGPLGF